MKKLAFTCGILFFALSMHAQTSIAGIWNLEKDNTKIDITKGNDTYEGKILSSDNANVKPGKVILKDVKSVNGKWQGKLYSPKKNEWFDAVLKVEGKKMQVTVKSGWASKTVEWTKG